MAQVKTATASLKTIKKILRLLQQRQVRIMMTNSNPRVDIKPTAIAVAIDIDLPVYNNLKLTFLLTAFYFNENDYKK